MSEKKYINISATEFLKISNKIAEHFGFKDIEHHKKRLTDFKKKEKPKIKHNINSAIKKTDGNHGLLSSALVSYYDEGLHSIDKPLSLYSVSSVPRSNDVAVTFHIFNVESRIAESIIIQSTLSLLSDLGHDNVMVSINSMGDCESINRYSNEVTNYLRKKLDTMPAAARELMKEHPLTAFNYLLKQNHEIAETGPSPMEYLSDNSRKYFRDLVEYFEITGIPYEIDYKLFGHHKCYSDTVFTINVNTETEEKYEPAVEVKGGRMDKFSKDNLNKDIPLVGVSIVLKNVKKPSRLPRIKKEKPSVYVVHLGFCPKIKSLDLIDKLRRAKIPVLHNLTNDSLCSQLQEAEKLKVRYVLIIGQKEFLDGTVIFRDMKVRNQEYVSVDEVIKKLKRKTSLRNR